MPQTFTSYEAYLQSPHWRSLRAQRVIFAKGRCEHCHKARRLEVHHTFYRDFWIDTQLDDLRALCPRCHRKEHRKIGRQKTPIPDKIPVSRDFAAAQFQAIRALLI